MRLITRPDDLDLIGRGFGFLNANHVGLMRGEKVQKALFEHRADAVDVPGNKFHTSAGVQPRAGRPGKLPLRESRRKKLRQTGSAGKRRLDENGDYFKPK